MAIPKTEVPYQLPPDLKIHHGGKGEHPRRPFGKLLAAAAVLITVAAGGRLAAGAIPSGSSEPSRTPGITQSYEPTLKPSGADATPTIRVTPSPTKAPTPEITVSPEQLAPNIPGLHETVDTGGNVIYLADKINNYKLAENAVAGYFDPNVEMKQTDGTVVDGGLDLDPKVIQELGVDGNHTPMPIDIGKDANVKITFDNNGWHNISRVHLAFTGETLAVSNIIPDSLNTLAVTHPGEGFTWLYASKHATIDAVTPLTDQTALEDTIVYGQADSTIDQTVDVITDKPVAFGAAYGKVTNSLSISISNGTDFRPVTPLMVGGLPVFTKAA